VERAGLTTRDDGRLWLTVRGAPALLPLAWLVWVALATLGGAWLPARVGSAGMVLLVLAAGRVLARRVPSPIDAFRRYHLDDAELTVIGPGRRVRRLAWSAVTTLTQEPCALALEAEGRSVRLPLATLVDAGAWGLVLARVVPGLADEMWALLEEGQQLRLAPRAEPALRALGWWAYAPALAACAAGAGSAGFVMAATLVLLERAIALALARTRTVALHRAGAGFRIRLWRLLVAWTSVAVLRAPGGLVLAVHGRTCNLAACGLPNFWAAAPVIEMKAHLGPRTRASVHFRVHLAEDGPAIVGEVE
jgi:hypothetical protein